MKAIPIILAVLLLAAPSLRAQIVNDGATRTLINETNSITGAVTVGTNGSFTLLVLSDNVLLTNSAHGVISVNASARSNEVRLTSPSASWLMGGTLFVGSNGPLSTLVVSNGAFVRANNGRIGSRAGSDSNVVVVTGSGSTWSSIGTFVGADLLVGGGGSGNQLIVRNGGRVMGNRDGIVGNNAGTSNNLARVSGSGSIWSNATSLRVGLNGTGNRLVIEAGGLAQCDAGTVGDFGSASNNEALVTGPGSLWTNFSSLTIGNQARGNRLVVSNGAAVKSGTGGVGSFSNQVVVTGIGSVWSNQTFLFVGGASNRVEVSDSGWLACNDGSIGPSFGANNNTAVLTGGGSGWNNLGSLIVGGGGNGNALIASNGATVLSSNATLGVNGGTANNNLAVITGAGTLWSNRNDLVVGSFGVGNRLEVNNGATLLSGNLFIGFNSISADNRVIVNGGTLRVTNASGTGVLDVRRGTNVLNAGLVDVDRLVVTNTAGKFELNGGTLSVKNTTVAHQQLFRVGNGVNPATFTLVGNSTHVFVNGLSISANAVLAGNGTIGNTVTVLTGGTLTPGTSIGKIVLFNPPSLQGMVIMEFSKNGAVLTNDQIQVTDTLTYGGSLTVSNVGPTPLTAGDRFQLFPAGSYAGSFTSVLLPALNPGLAWNNKLLVDGSIEVFALGPPTVQTLPASAVGPTNATLNGVANPRGVNATAWFEWGFSTNFGYVTPPRMLGNGMSNVNFSEPLTGLPVNVVHHFRAVASNSFGILVGASQSFFPRRTNTFTGDELGVSGLRDFYEYGASVAVSGDSAVIGAPGDSSNATGVNGNHLDTSAQSSGAAYVFVRNGTTWSQQAYLKASNTRQGYRFGTSVAVSGDTIVVGAEREDSNATGVNGNQSDTNAIDSGAAYVFVRNGTSWSQQAYLKASNTETFDNFGSSAAISGDTIVIGADSEDSNATGVNGNQTDNSAIQSGAAYVFVRNGTNWTQQTYLKASNTEAVDNFGISVSVSDDTVVLGAVGEDSNATGINGDQGNNSADLAGAAYVFVRSGTNWTQQAYLKGSDTGVGGRFGESVAASDERIVVGRSAHVFVRDGTIWSQEARLELSGTSVAISGGNAVVGAGTNVIVFELITNSWVGSLLTRGDQFAESFSVAISGDNIIVGQGGNDSRLPFPPFTVLATDIGRAFAFTRNSIEPRLQVEQSGHNLPNGGESEFLVPDLRTTERSFTLRNLGNAGLFVASVTIDGPDSAMFSVVASPGALVTPMSNTAFTVRFAPSSTGPKTATLHIASNDDEQNPFNILLHGLSLSFAVDSDGDGLNDASEALLGPFGFDFRAPQTNLVRLLFSNLGGATSNLNGIGFFTQSQLQALNVDTPLLAHDPLSGLFKLTIGVEKANDLINFFPFPMSAPQTIINAEGKLEFLFPAPDNAAFFRLEAR